MRTHTPKHSSCGVCYCVLEAETKGHISHLYPYSSLYTEPVEELCCTQKTIIRNGVIKRIVLGKDIIHLECVGENRQHAVLLRFFDFVCDTQHMLSQLCNKYFKAHSYTTTNTR